MDVLSVIVGIWIGSLSVSAAHIFVAERKYRREWERKG